jgi:TolB-like protein
MLKTGSHLPGEQEILSPQQRALVRQHLERILVSHSFSSSKRTQDFLRLIVEHALDGELENLKERMIGAEMFGRPVTYDTGSDSVVRVRATEARKKLALYYSEAHDDPVRIEIPSGSYVPRFSFPVPSAPHPVTVASDEHVLPPMEPAPVLTPPASIPDVPLRRPGFLRRSWRQFVLGTSLFLLLAGFFLYSKLHEDSIAGRGIHSIAILPLENLSGTPAQDYFADGLTEELINNLGQVSTLRVISLTSSMSYKGSKKKLPDIARELNVDAVVEGGVLREGDQVRISAQLIDARTDRPVWAHTYDRNITDVLSWQGEMAQAIAAEITTKVTPQEQARLARKADIDPAAQDFYLRGILARENGDCAPATDLFRQAIAISPAYAQVHSALASCYGMLGESGHMPYEKAFTSQKAEAVKAIQLDDSLSEAHAELANTAMTLDWDWPKADAEFHRALELNPNSATSHEKYAFFLVRTGRAREALAEIDRSVDLDPVSGSTFHSEGFIYYFSRQYERAYEVTQTVRNLRIHVPDWTFLLGEIFAEQRRYADSIAAFEKAGSGPFTLGHLGNVYGRAGNMDAARATIAKLEQLVQHDGVGRYEIALVYSGMGEKTEAFRWLEEAFRAHDVGLVYLKVDPCLDSLRSDPRFADLIRRVGLTP